MWWDALIHGIILTAPIMVLQAIIAIFADIVLNDEDVRIWPDVLDVSLCIAIASIAYWQGTPSVFTDPLIPVWIQVTLAALVIRVTVFYQGYFQ